MDARNNCVGKVGLGLLCGQWWGAWLLLVCSQVFGNNFLPFCCVRVLLYVGWWMMLRYLFKCLKYKMIFNFFFLSLHQSWGQGSFSRQPRGLVCVWLHVRSRVKPDCCRYVLAAFPSCLLQLRHAFPVTVQIMWFLNFSGKNQKQKEISTAMLMSRFDVKLPVRISRA